MKKNKFLALILGILIISSLITISSCCGCGENLDPIELTPYDAAKYKMYNSDKTNSRTVYIYKYHLDNSDLVMCMSNGNVLNCFEINTSSNNSTVPENESILQQSSYFDY